MAWWDAERGEDFWVEITDRDDLGADLAAPQHGENGQRYWSYEMVIDVAEGDVVLHYFTPKGAFTDWSRAIGEAYEDELLWGAHGYASGRGPVDPYVRPAWRRPLDGPYPLNPAVSMSDLQRRLPLIRQVYDDLRGAHTGPYYFPFQVSDTRPLRAFQGYMAKMPRAVLLAVPEFQPLVQLADNTRPRPGRPALGARGSGLGTAYRRPDEDIATSERDPHQVDPNLIDRALQGHARTQNALADAVRMAGRTPRSSGPGEPSFDLAWDDGETIYVAEIKSLTNTNQEKQLRLALGQVLRYRHLLEAKGRPVAAIVAVESNPDDPSWQALYQALDVALTWPPDFDGVTLD